MAALVLLVHGALLAAAAAEVDLAAPAVTQGEFTAAAEGDASDRRLQYQGRASIDRVDQRYEDSASNSADDYYSSLHIRNQPHYQCDAGYDNWRYSWSKQKQDFCCRTRSKGCTGFFGGTWDWTHFWEVVLCGLIFTMVGMGLAYFVLVRPAKKRYEELEQKTTGGHYRPKRKDTNVKDSGKDPEIGKHYEVWSTGDDGWFWASIHAKNMFGYTVKWRDGTFAECHRDDIWVPDRRACTANCSVQ